MMLRWGLLLIGFSASAYICVVGSLEGQPLYEPLLLFPLFAIGNRLRHR